MRFAPLIGRLSVDFFKIRIIILHMNNIYLVIIAIFVKY